MKYQLILWCLVLQSCMLPDTKAQKTESTMETKVMNQWIVEDLVKKWQGNKEYTLGVLEAMPEEHYDFVPAEGMMSFREQLVHVANGFNFHLTKTGHEGLPKIDDSSKKSIIESYTQIFNAIIAAMEEIEAAKLEDDFRIWFGRSTNLRMLNLMDNHLAHHRGSMIVYLRLKGVKPPAYIGW